MVLDLKKLCEEGQKKQLKAQLIKPADMTLNLYQETQTFPVIHGRRLKDPKQLQTEGFKPENLKFTEELQKALTYFHLEQLLDSSCQTHECQLVQQAHHYAPRQQRIYLSSYNGCYWASTNPEVISLLLRDLGVARTDILSYLQETYGEPYEIELDCLSPKELIDTFIEMITIPPTKIKTVRKCAIDDKALR